MVSTLHNYNSLHWDSININTRKHKKFPSADDKCACIHQSDISMGPWSNQCLCLLCTLWLHLESLGAEFTLQFEDKALYVTFSYDNVEHICRPALNQMGIIWRRYNYNCYFAGSSLKTKQTVCQRNDFQWWSLKQQGKKACWHKGATYPHL